MKHKDKVLDMPHGTAMHRLRKSIMFDMASKLGMNICFQCNKPIDNIDQFTLEHKKPWEYSNNPKELFFSLDNIAFSHPSCNHKAAIRHGGKALRKIKDGLEWCNLCKKFKQPDEFWKNKDRFNGLQNRCKECMKSNKSTQR